MKTRLTWILLALLAATLACQGLPGGYTPPTAAPYEMPTAGPSQAETPAAPAATESLALPLVQSGGAGPAVDVDALTAELAAQLNAGLPPTPTPDASGYTGFTRSIQVFPLSVAAGQGVLWAASSSGERIYEPDEPHFVAIYTHSDAGWNELTRLELPQHEIGFGAGQVNLPGGGELGAWLEASSAVGAHSGCYSLLHFDGQVLSAALENCNSTPPGGKSEDLDGDGLPEIILDGTNYYVSCYACGVQLVNEAVWRWDGTALVELSLERLPRPADPRLVELNDRAVDLAGADLWMEARELIHQARALDGASPTVRLNALLIERIAAKRLEAVGYSSYPLLSQVFFGNYAGAMDLLRAYSPEQIFSPQSPLINNDGLLDRAALGQWLADFSGRAYLLHYDSAEIHFIRGWAAWLQNPADPQALSRVQIAAGYAPDDTFYAACVAYLQGQP